MNSVDKEASSYLSLIKKECNDVQSKKKKNYKTSLRYLISKLNEKRLPYSEEKIFFLKKEGSFFKSTTNSLVRQLFLLNITDISPKPEVLWLKLLKEKKGLRKYSSEINLYFKDFLNLFDIGIDKILLKLSSHELYNLGFFNEAYKKNLVQKNDSLLNLKLECLLGKDILLEDVKLRLKSKEFFNFLSFWVVRSKDNEVLQKYLEEAIFSNEKLLSDNDPIFAVKVLNSINYLYLKQKKWEKVDLVFNRLEKYIALIKSCDDYEHIRGNYYLHKARVSFIMSNKAQFYKNIFLAMKSDYGFFEHYFIVAQILHDEGDPDCLKFYEMALDFSPFAFPILNDYLCGLNDFKHFDNYDSICEFLSKVGYDADKYE